MGSFRDLPNKYRNDPDFQSVEEALPRIAGLLNSHRIKLVAPDEELHVIMKSGADDKVRAIFVAPI
jgi:hypothetical protein